MKVNLWKDACNKDVTETQQFMIEWGVGPMRNKALDFSWDFLTQTKTQIETNKQFLNGDGKLQQSLKM